MSIINTPLHNSDETHHTLGQPDTTVDAISEETSKEILAKLEGKNNILKKIEALPPIPKTIIEIETLRNTPDKENSDLLAIISKDPMIIANVLKIANSAMYGFRGKVKSIDIAMRMLGFNMVSNIAISTAINTVLQPNLTPYDVNIDDFIHFSSIQSRIIERWNDPKIHVIKNDLQLAAFLQDIGKIIVSMILIEKKLVKNFQKRIHAGGEINETEASIITKSSAEITAMIFTHWKFNQKIIDLIQYSDQPENAPDELKIGASALKIVKTLSPVFKESFTKATCIKSLTLATSYGFETKPLEKVIQSFEN